MKKGVKIMKEKDKDKNKNDNWEEIGKLKNGCVVLCDTKNGIINIKESHKYAREPYPGEWSEISKIMKKNSERRKRKGKKI